MTKSHSPDVLAGGEAELVQRPQADVDVPVLQQLVVKAFLGEVGVQGDQGTVFLGGVGKRGLISGCLGPVLPDLLLGRVIILLGRLCPTEHILDI